MREGIGRCDTRGGVMRGVSGGKKGFGGGDWRSYKTGRYRWSYVQRGKEWKAIARFAERVMRRKERDERGLEGSAI